MVPPPGNRSPRHLLIRASAGTGKTFQLSNRLPGPAPRRRAGGADPGHRPSRARRPAKSWIGSCCGWPRPRATRTQAMRELDTFTGGRAAEPRRHACSCCSKPCGSCTGCAVSTLDSFFAQIARSFSLELGLPPGWQIVEDWEDGPAVRGDRGDADQGGPGGTADADQSVVQRRDQSRRQRSWSGRPSRSLYDLFLETDPAAWRTIPRHRSLREDELAAVLEDLGTAELPTRQMAKGRDEDCERALRGDWEAFLGKGLAAKVHQGKRHVHSKPIPDPVVALYQRLIEHVRAELVGRVAMQTEATCELLQKFHGEYQRRRQRTGRRGSPISPAACRASGPDRSRAADVPPRLPHRPSAAGRVPGHRPGAVARGEAVGRADHGGRQRLVPVLCRQRQAGDLRLARRGGGDLRRHRSAAGRSGAGIAEHQLSFVAAGDRHGEPALPEPPRPSESGPGRGGRAAVVPRVSAHTTERNDLPATSKWWPPRGRRTARRRAKPRWPVPPTRSPPWWPRRRLPRSAPWPAATPLWDS